jgi:hypothetical protein
MTTDAYDSEWFGKKFYPSANWVRLTRFGGGALGVVGIYALWLAFNMAKSNLDDSFNPLLCITPILAFIIAVGTFAWAGWSFISATQSYLMPSQKGIIFHQPGIDIQAGWDNVRRIDTLQGNFSNEGLVLRHPPTITGSPILRYFNRRKAFIPISMFCGVDWQKSKIGEEIHQYAPILFEDKDFATEATDPLL